MFVGFTVARRNVVPRNPALKHIGVVTLICPPFDACEEAFDARTILTNLIYLRANLSWRNRLGLP